MKIRIESGSTPIENVMRWAGMLSTEKEAMPPIPQPDVDYTVRRFMHPRVPHSGVVQYMVDFSEILEKVPDWKAYYTVDELHGRSRVVGELGHARSGRLVRRVIPFEGAPDAFDRNPPRQAPEGDHDAVLFPQPDEVVGPELGGELGGQRRDVG